MRIYIENVNLPFHFMKTTFNFPPMENLIILIHLKQGILYTCHENLKFTIRKIILFLGTTHCDEGAIDNYLVLLAKKKISCLFILIFCPLLMSTNEWAICKLTRVSEYYRGIYSSKICYRMSTLRDFFFSFFLEQH